MQVIIQSKTDVETLLQDSSMEKNKYTVKESGEDQKQREVLPYPDRGAAATASIRPSRSSFSQISFTEL